MSIGEKGMLVAARALAYSTMELLTDAQWIEKAQTEFEEKKAEQDFTLLLPKDQKAPEKIR